jgi:hypothetical protein
MLRACIYVDKRAFPKPIHMKVRSELLGSWSWSYDHGLWRNLEYFIGRVVDRYYQQVTGSPMISIQIGGSIGIMEVKMRDTILDTSSNINTTSS